MSAATRAAVAAARGVRSYVKASVAAPARLWLLEYTYDATDMDDVVRKRAPLRQAHLEWAEAWRKKGALKMGGAFGAASSKLGGMLVFDVAGRDAVQEFAEGDPYVKHKLVKSYDIKDWTVVISSP